MSDNLQNDTESTSQSIDLYAIQANPLSAEDEAVLMTFLNMPLESADAVFDKFSEIPGAILRRGDGLERFLFVEGTRDSRVLLVAHADTVWDIYYYGEDDGYRAEREIVRENGIVRNLRGGLGADDRAGCAIVWLLRDLGHSLLITDGEEHGQIGSCWLMEENADIANKINADHQFAVQFDRKNGQDFKCYDVGTDKFRCYVQEATGYSEPDRRSCTDIVTLCRDIPGVNLSVGYRNEHRPTEHLLLAEWANTLALCREWLARPELPKFDLNCPAA